MFVLLFSILAVNVAPGCDQPVYLAEPRMPGDPEEQADELLALSTILEPRAFSHTATGPHQGSLLVSVRLDSPVEVVPAAPASRFAVRHLPPLKLEFRLPADYPSAAPPRYCLSCPWLQADQRTRLEHRLQLLWTEHCGAVILFLWLNFLQEELMDFLHLLDGLDISGFEEKPPDETANDVEPTVESLKIIDADDDDGAISEVCQGVSPDGDSGVGTGTSNSPPSLAEPGVRSALPPAGPAERTRCRVKAYRMRGREGLLETWRGPALVRGWAVAAGAEEAVEASLEDGEEVEAELVEREGRWEGREVGLEAVLVTAPGGGPVRGRREAERGRLVRRAEVGEVTRWSAREGDGMVRGTRGEVYCCARTVQEEGGQLARGDKVTFHVVESRRWGLLATWVRRLGPGPGGGEEAGSCEASRRLGSEARVEEVQEAAAVEVQGAAALEAASGERRGGQAPRRRRRSGRDGPRLATILREFNNMKLEEEFSVQLFTCEVCFTASKTGSQCLKFVGCDHVYCR
jgi:cold shock CspA family protein